ncbi:uncharacterized protein EV154DRAFT_475526 [Mucor mucedo]|uniref:uncharacterized protein n=1 Tax=Mucor mucedo TaxID=29922 RepID=UPI002220B62A|nr:uncharacterized protein EV154DRAFT_475526 [Mucor mucedo]KAI7897202.1 hypothetical protein EV154DRAFT_475526 [Mucor mucedo]
MTKDAYAEVLLSSNEIMAFSSTLDRNLQEVPVTATPIFEGHLSVKRDKRHWQWRLFRFDGSNFTCLSSRKVKLSNETITNSNLLATPKDKNNRVIQAADENKIEFKYYQSPEWMIDVVDISAISVLKKKKSTVPSKCFSIRTFSGQCFILKAQKQKDLERWLFVLTKMWKFTQAVNEQIKVIDEWRKSLAELMACDPCIKQVVTPPPIESIPDDDTMSIFTDITSVSHRQRPNSIKRVKSRSSRKTKSNSISPAHQELPLEDKPVPTLRKRRSDDVRNWMNNNRDNINFFQDVGTSVNDEEISHVNNNNDILKYHTSIRGKKLTRVNNQGDLLINNNNDDDTSLNQKKRRASIPLLSTQNINSLRSPLQTLSKKKEEEEEMSLADLQKSLWQVSLHNRSTSASSIQDLQKRQQQLYFNQSIVAPAIPPLQLHTSPYHYHHYHLFDQINSYFESYKNAKNVFK